MTHDEGSRNNSGNRPFQDILEARRSRRQVLRGGLGAAATTFFAAAPLLATAQWSNPAFRPKPPLLGFNPVPVAGGGGDVARVSSDYEYDVILPWGDPIAPDSVETIGIGHDGMAYFPLNRKGDHGVLAINHEYGDNEIVIGKRTPSSLDDVRASQYAHGLAMIELERKNGKWETTNKYGFGRRIHVNTPVEFSGPVAGTSLLENAANNIPRGTVNNCANGRTPWGTYLTCEENFNGYFGATGSWTPTLAQERYGFSRGSGYGWHLFDERFDLSNPDYANEDKRFGWIVEVDPTRPETAAVKRTALGRFKHEGIAIIEGRGGRIVGYMGDDQAHDYIYKFVSEKNWRTLQAEGKSPLDHGSLYVARFNEDGTGEWLELTIENPALAAEFNDQAEVLTFARIAADILGATPMDRPEWTTVASNGMVYCTLTNNSARSVANAANPMVPNADGHIIRWLDSDHHVGLTFEWDIFLIAADTHGTEESFADPDGLWVDPDGRLFIQTDGGQKDGLNNQMLVADTETGEVKRLFEGVAGCEVTGLTMTPDRRTLFCNLQHPSATSAIPKDATIVITRKDGGIVGS